MKAPILLALAGLSILSVQAAEPTGTLIFACEGTATYPDEKSAKTDSVSMGIVVDFMTSTVHGFRSGIRAIPGKITSWDKATVNFAGPGDDKYGVEYYFSGTINRVTGDIEARFMHWGETTAYSLKCKPTQRMF
jgi:hypothetical protein